MALVPKPLDEPEVPVRDPTIVVTSPEPHDINYSVLTGRQDDTCVDHANGVIAAICNKNVARCHHSDTSRITEFSTGEGTI
jgi:hypothetical protein